VFGEYLRVGFVLVLKDPAEFAFEVEADLCVV